MCSQIFPCTERERHRMTSGYHRNIVPIAPRFLRAVRVLDQWICFVYFAIARTGPQKVLLREIVWYYPMNKCSIFFIPKEKSGNVYL